ncbi:MAG: dihydroorotase [Christiangramia sp.]|uniref:dihydroorotase n=1 Tax=Christiangramia sp. TaxID=1931228 RepID=UPI003241CF6A
MKLLLKSAKIVDPASSHHGKTVDILIENGRISKIGNDLEANYDRKIDIPNLHVSQGWFDSSVSFGEPGFEDRETITNGLDTAAKSGFTAVALNPNSFPVLDHSSGIFSVKSKAAGHAVKLYPVGALSLKSEGIDLAELLDMQDAGAVSFGDYKSPVSNPNLLKIALQYAQNFNALVQSFPLEKKIAGNGIVNEHHTSTSLGLKGIPNLAEELQIARDLYILEYTGGKLHIPTISTAKAAELISEAKQKGLDVSCSVAVHQLLLDDQELKEFDANFKVLPPLRTSEDRQALVEAVKNGSIDMVTSDHDPIDVEHKKVEFDNAMFGTIGLESAFGALSTVLETEKVIEMLTSGKDRFGIPSEPIAENAKADLSLFVPGEEYVFGREHIYSTSKNSIFLNKTLKGKVIGIITENSYQINE